MKIAYFDCSFGAAGDMLLGALIAAGLPEQQWRAELTKIALPDNSFTVRTENVLRCSILSKAVVVETLNAHNEERHLNEIIDIINRSNITIKAKQLAKAIFQKLGEAEAKVHGLSVDQIHFHEVGAIDAIVDIVGFAIGYDMLGIETSYCSALPLGCGTVQTRHGTFPVPGPATLVLLTEAGAPIISSNISYECLTPTAAAILTTVTDQWGYCPSMQISGIGYGAGTRNPDSHPNITRLLLGELQSNAVDKPTSMKLQSANFASELIAVLEANLDDITPQVLSYTTERLFEAGALDVAVVPAVMKKGRSGQLLSVLCKPEQRATLGELILRQTSSLGVRSYLCERLVAERKWREVMLDSGEKVRVKLGLDKAGTIINAQPEYEDCASHATAYGLPLKKVSADAVSKIQILD